MTATSLGTLLAIVGAFVVVGGVVLLITSRDLAGVPASSSAAEWCIIIAGVSNVASGVILRRQVWARDRRNSDG